MRFQEFVLANVSDLSPRDGDDPLARCVTVQIGRMSKIALSHFAFGFQWGPSSIPLPNRAARAWKLTSAGREAAG